MPDAQSLGSLMEPADADCPGAPGGHDPADALAGAAASEAVPQRYWEPLASLRQRLWTLCSRWHKRGEGL